MDGIFGVGVAEMIIIALVLFIIGGPENTAKWARQAGRYVRQMREMWAEFVKDIETELGPEGKELMDVTRELGQGASEFRRATSPRRLVADSARYVESLARDSEPSPARKSAAAADAEQNPAPANTPVSTPEPPATAATEHSNDRYRAWRPPDDH